MKSSIFASILFCALFANAQTPPPAAPPSASPVTPSERAAVKAVNAQDTPKIDSACSAEISAGNCSNEVIGKGLLRCIHAYKKSGHSISSGCQAALQSAKADRKAAKGQ